jgi:ADP-ribose pyrophosphatase YjhB (NUDIX family)
MRRAHAVLVLPHGGAYKKMSQLTRDWTVATFVIHQAKVLLLWHEKLQMWLPPGGHVEPNELPDEAAVREVLEETGIRVELLSQPTLPPFPGVRSLARPEAIQLEQIGPNHEHIDLVYFARPANPNRTEPTVDREVRQVGWYSLEEAGALPLTEEIRTWIRKALADR